MTVLRVSDQSTRAEIEQVLRDVCHRAKRCMPKVGTDACPTPWDESHSLLDHVLDDWRAAAER